MTHTQTQGADGAGTFTGRPQPLTILYTNWRGETAVRRILIDAIAYGNEALGLAYGRNEWHPEEQWLLSAIDADKGERRTFAMAGIKAWGQAAVDAALADGAGTKTAGEVVTDEMVLAAYEHWRTSRMPGVLAGPEPHKEWIRGIISAANAAATPAPAATPGVPDSLRALSEAASPGEATFEIVPYHLGDTGDTDLPGYLRLGGVQIAEVHEKYGPGVDPRYEADGKFVAAAINHVRALIAAQPAGQSAGWDAIIRSLQIEIAIAQGANRALKEWIKGYRINGGFQALGQHPAGPAAGMDGYGSQARPFNPAPNTTRTGAAETGGEPLPLSRIKDAISYSAHCCQDGSATVSRQRLLEWREGIRAALAARPEAPSDAGWGERAATEIDAIAHRWGAEGDADGRAYAKTIAAILRAESPTPPSDPAHSGQAEG